MKLKQLIIDTAEQGSKEWRIARLGKFTATRISDLMSKGKKKDDIFGATAITMMAEVAAERDLDPVVIEDDDKFQYWSDLQCRENMAMRYGKDNEALARNYYEFHTGNQVEECGVVTHPEIPTLAGSPDGLVVKGKGKEVEGIIEIKCPSTTKTCMRYRWFIKDSESLKMENASYYWQCQQNMNVTGAKWCDFIVYSPFLKNLCQIVRIERNEEDIALINERALAAEEFIKQMNNG